MDRQPVVAGQFYPSDRQTLESDVRAAIGVGVSPDVEPTLLAMAPHAGYVYSGRVAGHTLGQARLPRRIVLLGPNHTGLGAPLSLWPSGRWITPLGPVPVDEALVAALLDADPDFSADYEAHAREHSLEVMLPFLQTLAPGFLLTALTVAEPSFQRLETAGLALAKTLAGLAEPACMVVSSDMSHYVTHKAAKRLDSLALEAILALDPEQLYNTVRGNGITMCGVLPMTLALIAARQLGAKRARLAAYATSGQVTGDFDRVVGYAGVLIN
ncbi:AmmeMemoRadiSam system protein B [Fundidesulfovibrio butyratiphilus]